MLKKPYLKFLESEIQIFGLKMTPPLWHFSENSSDLVARPFPKCSARLGRGQQLVHLSQQQFRHLLKIGGRESVVFTDIDSLPDSQTNQNN